MPAEEAYVLSPTDVRKIRSYVHHKYAAMPQEARAEIVADAVSRIIHKQLPDFEDKMKRAVTAELIRMSVVEQQRPVKADDIFQICLGMSLNESSNYEPLHKWVEEQLKISCEKPVLRRLLDELTKEDNLQSERRNGSWLQLKGLLTADGLMEQPAAAVLQAADIFELPYAQTAALKKKHRAKAFIYGLLSLLLLASSLLYGWSLSKPSVNRLQPPVMTKPVTPAALPVNEMPGELQYHEINRDRLKDYLKNKSSALAEQPYFDAIISAAESFDLHPVLLFAITGQEQGFVPVTDKQHKKIANNPFNVFHSWQEFNTNIQQSAEIAARTVSNLSKNRPSDVDPFTWINRKYAEDPNWADGVRSIFTAITAYIETETIE
ncbi:glucosaminidase domain-containing protein [Paenibacillus harenae]|uniref:glucosaminidase domain-containing protein n=1 Tax=Paenibacillus harenae TaxID=306543 RepID=UPI000423C3CD|nr:glucosaminidase domain-containing protein [Paenibacillus harenae]